MPASLRRNPCNTFRLPLSRSPEKISGNGLLAPFLYILPHEFLTVFLEDFVNFIQKGIDVLGHFLVALGDLGVDRGLDLVGLLARARRLLLPAVSLVAMVALR